MIRIDAPVKSFVIKLNRITGVYPASSCGGHKNAKNGGVRCPEKEFFVIIKIKNDRFLKKIRNLTVKYNFACRFEYNPMYGTWCLQGTYDVLFNVFEPFVDDMLPTTSNLKPETDWEKFYSYGSDTPCQLK